MSTGQYEAKQHYQDPAVANAYEEQRFRGWGGRFVERAERRLLEQFLVSHCRAGETVLDVPCGTGRFLDIYSAAGLQVFGCDISNQMLAKARQRIVNGRESRFVVAEAERLGFKDNSFDYLVSFRFILHLPAEVRRLVLSEMVRVTRRTLAINFYFSYPTPVLLINQLFRRKESIPPHRFRESRLAAEFEGLGVEIREVHKLSWFDRNWALVILERHRGKQT
ncbi:MAG: class I SAM-dependent methyltransferase [Terriglobia bacterium]